MKTKFFLLLKNYLTKSFKYRQKIIIGGSKKSDVLIVDYDKLQVKFKKIVENNQTSIYISNEIKPDKLGPESSCITIRIDKGSKEAYIEGISSDNSEICLEFPDFILKHPASFYLKMTIKMLKKYKNEFNINKITLKDNATIKLPHGLSYNLSQFKILTEGLTWYGKYGFKITEKNHRKEIEKSINVLKNIKVKELDLKKLFRQIEKDLKFKYVDKDLYNNVKENFIKNPNAKLMDILYFIFVKNRSKKTNIIYSVMIDKLLDELGNNFDDFYRLKTTSYYLII